MKVVTLDLETSPNLADVWGLRDQTVSLSQLRDTTRVISFASKEYGKKRVEFYSEFHHGRDAMIHRAYRVLDEADVIVHFNGKRFDIPHLMREFIEAGYTPPAPFKQVDLLAVARQHFRFTSFKLDHLVRQLGIGAKVSHSGHDLWVRCMAGDEKAWATMRTYNRHDVVVTEKLYDRLRPWITNHPSVGLIDGTGDCCNKCGGTDLERRGLAYTAVGAYQQYRCRGCGGWSRSGKRVDSVDQRGVS